MSDDNLFPSRWGPTYRDTPGYIAEAGASDYRHVFGGSSWDARDPEPAFGGPTLLLRLDLRDPCLSPITLRECDELPLCSYINSSVWEGRQVYQIHPDERVVELEHRDIGAPAGLPAEVAFPRPLPEVAIRLRRMTEGEYPVDRDSYYDAFEEFARGSAFVRVLGPPLLIDPVSEICGCGRTMRYVAGIGAEASPSAIYEAEAFFIGEGCLYFYLCDRCLRFHVISQGT